MSDHTGQLEVYLRPFPNLDDGLWLVSSGGGERPRWGPSGELFYLGPGELIAVSVEGDVTPSIGKPQALYSLDGMVVRAVGQPYDVSPTDGRFLWARHPAGGATEQTPIVVLNWHKKLLERMPIP